MAESLIQKIESTLKRIDKIIVEGPNFVETSAPILRVRYPWYILCKESKRRLIKNRLIEEIPEALVTGYNNSLAVFSPTTGIYNEIVLVNL